MKSMITYKRIALSKKGSGAQSRVSRISHTDPDHIKRPMNSFMCFLKQPNIQELIRAKNIPYDPKIRASVVAAAGILWKSLTTAEKNPFLTQAQTLAEQFSNEHPGYKYQPKRLGQKTRVSPPLPKPQQYAMSKAQVSDTQKKEFLPPAISDADRMISPSPGTLATFAHGNVQPLPSTLTYMDNSSLFGSPHPNAPLLLNTQQEMLELALQDVNQKQIYFEREFSADPTSARTLNAFGALQESKEYLASLQFLPDLHVTELDFLGLSEDGSDALDSFS